LVRACGSYPQGRRFESDLRYQPPMIVTTISLLVSAGLTLVSPADYQVFQRSSKLGGKVFVSGMIPLGCDSAQVRLANRTGWVEMPVDASTRSFAYDFSVPSGGWYRLEVRALKSGRTIEAASIEHVGMGEVFVGAGQSNSTNSGGEGRLFVESGMVSTFSGSDWRIANDPQPGVHDRSTGGSFWPAFGDAMARRYKVPIGLAVTGHGGTSVNQWQKGSELFEWTLTRIRQLGRGGFRALLWHQGESDTGMAMAEYRDKLAAIIADSRAAAGWAFPWFVARVSYHNPAQPMFDSTRDAQKALWDAGIALEGPDTDALGFDNRDNGGKGIHFSPKGLRAHGAMWADKVAAWLDKALKSGR
jgi:hypothetical protein